jgi:lactam utilization protein B
MKNNKENKGIVPSEKREIKVSNSSLAKRGLELIAKPDLDDIIRFGKRITAANVSQLSRIALFGDGALNEVIWSHDNTFLIVSTLSGIYTYDAKDLSRKKVVEEPTYSLSISMDGRILMSVSPDNDIFSSVRSFL